MAVKYLILFTCFFICLGAAAQPHQDGWRPDDTTIVQLRFVTISGNKKTKDYIVKREYAFQQGATYTGKDLMHVVELTREQLYNTSLFVDVIFNLYDAGNNQVDIFIQIKERLYFFPLPYFKIVDRNWNEWINTYKASLDHVNLGLKLSHNNMTGRNDKSNLFLITGYTQEVSFNYAAPYLDSKLQHGLSFGFGYSRNREVNYATDSNKLISIKEPFFAKKTVRGSVGYTYRKGSHQRQGVTLGFTHEEIDSSIGKLNLHYFGSNKLSTDYFDLTYAFQCNYVDYRFYPLTGYSFDFSATRRFGPDVGMWSFGGKFLESWKILPTTYFAFQAAGALKFLDKQTYYNSHLMGYGDLAMRGLEYYVIDGTAGGFVRGTLRQKLFSFTFKNFIKSKTHDRIPFCFYAKTYSDIGYAYSEMPGNSLLNNKLLHTAGFGLDIVTVYDVAIKLEYTFNQLGGSGFFLHTSADF